MLAVFSTINAPSSAGRPNHLAARTRMMCALEKISKSPALFRNSARSIPAGAHVRRGFAGWTTIAKQPPARVGDDDLLRRRAFVGAVVPFGEIGALLALDAETREHSGAERSLGWAGQDGREAPSREPGAKPTGS